jgi:hypothetical protein
MAGKKWLPIVVGIVIFVVLVGAGLVAGFAYMVSRQVQVQQVSATAGQEEFDRLVAGMAGQTPLIELPDGELGGRVEVHRELETKQTGSITQVHVRVWSPRDHKLVRVDLPFWLLRLGGNRPMVIDSGSREGISLRVTPEEVDRRGPGLLLNHGSRNGERVLIWTE